MSLREIAYQASYEELENRILTVKKIMDDADASSKNETKSSAGDKFETSRAMMQREKENNKVKLIKLMELKHQFQSIPKSKTTDYIGLGSFVESNKGNFFIGIGLGKIKTSSLNFVAVSTDAPLIKSLLGLKKGDQVLFNQQSIQIINVE